MKKTLLISAVLLNKNTFYDDKLSLDWKEKFSSQKEYIYVYKDITNLKIER